MTTWIKSAIQDLEDRLEADPSPLMGFDPFKSEAAAGLTVHLAVFVEPYLQFILDGRKTVESRFSSKRCAPYGVVQPGDLVLLKQSGGPVLGICQVAEVWFYRLDPSSWREIRTFANALCVSDPKFWSTRQNASYATLMRIQRARTIQPFVVPKRDRRGWVILQKPQDRWPLLNPPSAFPAGRHVRCSQK